VRRVAFYFLLAVVFAIPFETVLLLPGVGTLTRTFGLVAFAAWGLSLLVTRRVRRPESFHLLVVGFIVWVVMSFFWTVDIPSTYERIVTFVQLLGLVLMVWDLCDRAQAIRAALQAYVLGASVTFIALLLVSFGGGVQEYSNRLTSVGADPNNMALSFALGVPMAWYLALHTNRRAVRWANGGYLAAAMLGIALSGSRAGVIAGVIAILFVLTTFAQLRYSAITASLAVVAGGLVTIRAFVPARTLDRLMSIGDEFARGDLNGRVAIWRDGLNTFIERPILGSGAGTIRFGLPTGTVGHNLAVEMGVELGIVGLVLLGAVLVVAVRRAAAQASLESRLWLFILATWAVGAGSLNVDHSKVTWFLLSLVVAGAAVVPSTPVWSYFSEDRSGGSTVDEGADLHGGSQVSRT
jgi:O-antigen ligase